MGKKVKPNGGLERQGNVLGVWKGALKRKIQQWF